MEINTKFNIGDLIYTVDKGTFDVQTFKVNEISIRVNPQKCAGDDETDHEKDRFSNPNKRIYISFICGNKRIGYQDALSEEEVKVITDKSLEGDINV